MRSGNGTDAQAPRPCFCLKGIANNSSIMLSFERKAKPLNLSKLNKKRIKNGLSQTAHREGALKIGRFLVSKVWMAISTSKRCASGESLCGPDSKSERRSRQKKGIILTWGWESHKDFCRGDRAMRPSSEALMGCFQNQVRITSCFADLGRVCGRPCWESLS